MLLQKNQHAEARAQLNTQEMERKKLQDEVEEIKWVFKEKLAEAEDLGDHL